MDVAVRKIGLIIRIATLPLPFNTSAITYQPAVHVCTKKKEEEKVTAV
jgi:hypothetical protein